MSKCSQHTVDCPECGHEQQFTVWDSVNSTLNPELKDQLISWELVTFECEACGEQTHLIYPILYHDMDKKLMIWLANEEDLPGAEDFGFLAEWGINPEAYTLRWVDNYKDLIEKIRLTDEGIDDRVFELFKSIQRMQHGDMITDADDVYFNSIEEVDGRTCILMAIVSPDNYRVQGPDVCVFEELAARKDLDLDTIFPPDGLFRRINHHDL